MGVDTNFKGKYIIVKHGCKDYVLFECAKILTNPYTTDLCKYNLVDIEIIQSRCNNEYTPFENGDMSVILICDIDISYDIVNTKLEVVTRLL